MLVLAMLDNHEKTPNLRYCLYARKSSESDEKQAMSIGSQLDEMRELAEREGLNVVIELQESHSAKDSGKRPVYTEMLKGIADGEYDAVLTWAPDRLSRNAGDLGSIVDLMDQGKLLHIKTFSQTFSNNPNEKFLLMILCSQAKLENDNKSINVMRGMKTKLNMGWRPGVAPLGYMNRAFNGIKDIMVDAERAPHIKQIFDRTVQGASGREIQRWLREVGCTNRSGKDITLSQVYLILNNTFYYGEFEWPEKSGKWYKGAHEPLITKELFDQIHNGRVDYKGKWGSKRFAFKGLLTCGKCGSAITAEEKFKLLKDGTYNRHVYYSCAKGKNRTCDQKYINEKKLSDQIKGHLYSYESTVSKSFSLKKRIHEHENILLFHLKRSGVELESFSPFQSYIDYVFSKNVKKDIAELINGIDIKFKLLDGDIIKCDTKSL
jgi:site-specific DNA recombinase